MTSTDLELEDNDLKNVHFIDFLNYDELSKYLYAADLFALTTREDIWGLVINEAASFGLPIISTKKCIAATELVVDGKNGYLVNVDDINETSQAINLCRKNFSHICVDSLNISKEYTIEKMANAYINCFNEFMN